jgi:hypothetical protein
MHISIDLHFPFAPWRLCRNYIAKEIKDVLYKKVVLGVLDRMSPVLQAFELRFCNNCRSFSLLANSASFSIDLVGRKSREFAIGNCKQDTLQDR